MPRGVYPRTEAHRLAYKQRSNNPSYRKALSDAWTPERRATVKKAMQGRQILWRDKISNSVKDWHADNKEAWEQRVGKLTPLERAFRNRLKMYKYNAKAQKRVWELTDEEARTLFLAACYYCGGAPGEGSKRGKTAAIPLNGIDRKDNGVGYTCENSLSCCWICNRNKGSMDHEQFLAWIHRIASKHQ